MNPIARLSIFFALALVATDSALAAPKLTITDLVGPWKLVATTKYNLAGFGSGKGSSGYSCELTASGSDTGELNCESDTASSLALNVTLSKNGKKLRWSSDTLETDPGFSGDLTNLVGKKDTNEEYFGMEFEESSHKYVNFKATRKALTGGSYLVNGKGTGIREIVINSGSEDETTREVEYAKRFSYQVKFAFSR